MQSQHAYHEFKERIHRRLVEKLDLAKLDTIPQETLRTLVREVIESLLSADEEVSFELNREGLTEEILNETFGLGPLEPLLHDPTISDILVNTCSQVYVERFGKLETTNTRFKDDVHLLNIIERIVSKVGRRVDESSPMVDARLPDGSRVNAIIPPLAIDGPILSIRKFGLQRLAMDDLLRLRSLTPAIAELLAAAVRARLNILVSGGTGSGKTTLLNILSGFIPSGERIITVEDAAELQLQQRHTVRLETRAANIEGRGAIVQRDLVRNALRMRPDRIIVGEVRGAEALDMLQAMNTGHDGSLTTLHANSPRDALRRLETMVLMASANLGDRAMREQISSAIHIIVQISRLSDGSRKVVKVVEIVGMEGETISLQDIFLFEKLGIREDGQVVGTFRTTGIRPKFIEQIETAGIRMPDEMFEPRFELPPEEEPAP
ncbi:MAG TPA: CpaF family protein [bacterium]|nr:CpaF family protein [bacterium]HOY44919.1 CpaF family protein [bacterium]HPG84070.1 CpaF family protein [bacterium]HPM59863.1 CpaF family protein [bacterium]